MPRVPTALRKCAGPRGMRGYSGASPHQDPKFGESREGGFSSLQLPEGRERGRIGSDRWSWPVQSFQVGVPGSLDALPWVRSARGTLPKAPGTIPGGGTWASSRSGGASESRSPSREV